MERKLFSDECLSNYENNYQKYIDDFSDDDREIVKRLHNKQIKKGLKYYENQEIATFDVLNQMYKNDQSFYLIIAQPGSGKSGVKDKLVYYLRTHPDNEFNIFGDRFTIMTGLNSKSWIEDSINRFHFLPEINDNLKGLCYHLPTIKKRIDYLIKHPNLLYKHIFIIDEAHIACLENQTFDKQIFKKLNLTLEIIKKFKIKFIFVSATPDILKLELSITIDCKEPIIFTPGDTYKGFQFLKENNKIIDIREKKIDNWGNYIIDLLNKCKKPFNHIVRCRSSTNIKRYELIKKILILNNINIIEYNQKTAKNINFQQEISKIPVKHNVFLIKNMFTASTRLQANKNINYVIEIPGKERDDTVTSQGLIGRFCEYTNNTSKFDNIKFIIDLSAINSYLKYINDKTYLKYQSRNIKNNKIRGSKKSAIHDQLVFQDNIKISCNHKEFNTYEDALRFTKSKFNRNIRRKNNIDKDGFICNHIRDKTEVMTYKYVISNIGWGLSKKLRFRYHICYDDITDINSIKHIITYKNI